MFFQLYYLFVPIKMSTFFFSSLFCIYIYHVVEANQPSEGNQILQQHSSTKQHDQCKVLNKPLHSIHPDLILKQHSPFLRSLIFTLNMS